MERLQFVPENVRNQKILEVQSMSPEQQQLYFVSLAQSPFPAQTPFQPPTSGFGGFGGVGAGTGPQIQVIAQAPPSSSSFSQLQTQQMQQKEQEKKNSRLHPSL